MAQQDTLHQHMPSDTMLSATVIKHELSVEDEASYISGDEETVIRNHRRDITEVFDYDTSTLNKEFQKEIVTVFSQFQDDLREKQDIINKQTKTIKQLQMQSSKYELNMKNMKQEKNKWQTKTIQSIQKMINQQTMDQLSQQFDIELNNDTETIDDIIDRVKNKHDTNTDNETTTDDSKISYGNYLFVLGLGLVIGYIIRDKNVITNIFRK